MDEYEDETCAFCGSKDGFDPYDGFYYCVSCNTQVEGMLETCAPKEEITVHGRHRLFGATTQRLKERTPPAPAVTLLHQSLTCSRLTAQHVSSEVRMRYVLGVQLMVQSQCQVLIERFGASPTIAGLASIIWLRFVASTSLFHPNWADDSFSHSELDQFRRKGVSEKEPRLFQDAGVFLVNMYGQSAAKIWLRSLKTRIPLSYSLAVSFLSCHMARDPILPTDIYNWSLQGQLPYLTAFLAIQKSFPPTSPACPFTSAFMFKPFDVVPSRDIEFQSAFIAHTIGLQLPPVNFFAIARRYLNHLSLPFENILPHALCIFEWSMPPDLWLSTNSQTPPTRVSVMSIILITLRILCNINGFGYWEASLSKRDDNTYTKPRRSREMTKAFFHIPDSDISSQELLTRLEAVYQTKHCTYDYAKDLPTYLDYCKNVAFVGINSLLPGNEEERIIEKLWNFYEDQEDGEAVGCPRAMRKRSPMSKGLDADKGREGFEDDLRMKRLKLNMEDNGFCYIPPRANVKRYDYLHYIRKNDGGRRSNVAHADYYILLRACAKVAQVGVGDMHAGSLELEKRLCLIENLIDQSICFRAVSS